MDTQEEKDRIEFAIYILNHPEENCKQEIKQWLMQTDNRKLLEQLRLFLEAGLYLEKDIMPDIESKLKKFYQKKKAFARRKFMHTISIAASILLFIGGVSLWGWYKYNPLEKEIVTAQISTGKNQVILTTGTGKQIVLDDQHHQNLNLDDQTNICYDSTSVIHYSSSKQSAQTFHTLKIPKGREYRIMFEDGTIVWLNSCSELVYPTSFSKECRKVKLKGEAYFSVAKDSTKPFIVITEGIYTRVYGTEFNIRSYDKEHIDITLVNGKVSVSNKTEKEYILNPGENARFTGGISHIEKVNLQKYIAWKEGYFYYENERLEYIIEDLKRWYDFDVVYIGEQVKNLCFELWATRDSRIETVIEMLTRTNEINIKIDGTTLIISKVNE